MGSIEQQDEFILNYFANGSPDEMGIDVTGCLRENLPGRAGAYERKRGERFEDFIQRAERGIAEYCSSRGAEAFTNIDRAGLNTRERVIYAGVVWVPKRK